MVQQRGGEARGGILKLIYFIIHTMLKKHVCLWYIKLN